MKLWIATVALAGCFFGTLSGDKAAELDSQIDQLQQKIDQFQLDELNTNVDAQKYMFGQSADYAKAMKRVKEIDDQIELLQQQISGLRAERDKLLQEAKPSKE